MQRPTPLRIFLGDLTYTTLSLATEAFPLNIGYVAAYCAKLHRGSVELTLFKYVDDLERALHAAPPDVLGLSNYPWNHRLGIEMFAQAKELAPDTLCVMGGPNISHRASEQREMLSRCRSLDVYVYLEGELGFANLVTRVLEGPDLDRTRILAGPIDGCLFLADDGELIVGQRSPRKKALDEFPSPYLEGFMDPFFDGLLSPMLETNRGCPFSCTFCHEGASLYSKVNFFSLERVEAELDYVAARIPEGVENLMFSDPNFGMYRRDRQICEKIARIQAHCGWPRDIFATTGKNNRERIAGALEALNGTMQMWMSVQSMDAHVLENIRRDNIGIDAMMEIQARLETRGLPSKAEIILGLPGETPERHLATIRSLVEAGVDTITPYTLMLLHGTELHSPESRERFGFQTRFRVLPRDFGRLANGSIAIEVEEVVVGSRDLTIEDYVRLRCFHFVLAVVYNGKPCAPLFRYLKERGADPFRLLRATFDAIDGAGDRVRQLMCEFEAETRAELWESEAELLAFYGDDANYERLVRGEAGANLLQKYVAISLASASEDWIGHVFDVACGLLTPTGEDARVLSELRRYCTARVQRLLDRDRMADAPEAVLSFDYESWMRDPDKRPLAAFRYPAPRRGQFLLSAEQCRMLESYLGRFGSTHQGVGKTFTKMNIMHAWRRFVVLPAPDATPGEETDSVCAATQAAVVDPAHEAVEES